MGQTLRPTFQVFKLGIISLPMIIVDYHGYRMHTGYLIVAAYFTFLAGKWNITGDDSESAVHLLNQV